MSCEIVEMLRRCAENDCIKCKFRKNLECLKMITLLAAHEIEQLAAENKALRAKLPRWRNANEELPKKDGYYLCMYAVKEQIREARFYNVLWYHASVEEPHWMEVGRYGAQVTHWMPLPETEDDA